MHCVIFVNDKLPAKIAKITSLENLYAYCIPYLMVGSTGNIWIKNTKFQNNESAVHVNHKIHIVQYTKFDELQAICQNSMPQKFMSDSLK